MRLANTLTLILASLSCATAWSEEVALPASPTEAAAPVATPTRGANMSKVESQFGAPTQRNAAVGKPPITRWDYPGFSVFFEYQHVIHSVLK